MGEPKRMALEFRQATCPIVLTSMRAVTLPFGTRLHLKTPLIAGMQLRQQWNTENFCRIFEQMGISGDEIA